jgi:hypothetical protein
MASEVGVLPVAAENIKEKGRLQPGRMFLIDFEQGRLVPDEELKSEFSQAHPARVQDQTAEFFQSLTTADTAASEKTRISIPRQAPVGPARNRSGTFVRVEAALFL